MTNETRQNSKSSTLPAVLRVFSIVSVVLLVACLASESFCRHTTTLHHLPYTHGTLDPSGDYADLRMFLDRFPHFHHPDFFAPNYPASFSYPPTLALFEEFFYLFGNPGIAFLVTMLLILVTAVMWFQRALVRRGLSQEVAGVFAGLAALSSYPFYFELNRANLEIFVWLFTGLGVVAFIKKRPWWAATCIGVAGSCKFYPFVYLGLLIARRQYRQAAWSFVAGGIVALIGLWAETGNIALSAHGTTHGMDVFRQVYVLHKSFGEIGLDHSIFGMYKRFAPHLPPPDQLAHLATIYLAVAAIVGTFAYFARAIKLPVVNQAIFLTVACIVLPPVSFDYTLLHLYTPFVLMVFLAVDCWKRDVDLPKGAWAAFICFTLLLGPLSEFIIHGERIEGQLKCVVLLVLAAIALRYPFATRNSTTSPVSQTLSLESA